MVPELEEHCPSYLSFVASAAEDTEDLAAQPRSFVGRNPCTVTALVEMGIVRKVRGSLVVVRRYRSSPPPQERWGRWSLTWGRVQQVVEELEGYTRQ